MNTGMALKSLLLSLGLLALLACPILARRSVETSNQENCIHCIEEDAQNFVRDANKQYSEFLDFFKKTAFHPPANIIERIVMITIYKEMVIRIGELAKEARNIPRTDIRDAELKRQLEILSDAGFLALEDKSLFDFIYLKDVFTKLYMDYTFCSYQNKDNCELAYTPDIVELVSRSLNATELQYYWEELRNKRGPEAKDNFNDFVRLFRNASEINEKTPTELWYSNYKDSSISTYMEDVMMQIKPFYTEFHAYIRWALQTIFGENVVARNGLLPHHLVEKFLVDDDFLPQPYSDKTLPTLGKELNGTKLNARSLVDIADEFFKSMGFESLPASFWSSDCEESEDEFDCKSEIFDLSSNVALRYCPKVDFANYLQLHSNMARLHYANQKNDLPYTQFQSFQLELAVGDASILAACSPKHTKRIGIMQNDTFYEQTYINEIFRMGLYTLFTIPLHFVHNKIVSEIVSGQVKFNDMNKRYWELMEEYAGIEPPSQRSESDFDFPPDFYEDIWENHFASNFINHVLRYQLHRELCKISGEYIQDSPNHQLKDCDYSSSTEAGDSLKRMMTLGGKKPWKEVLGEIIKSEPLISGDALLEYYQPLRDWLKEQNKLNNVKIGWPTHRRTV